MYLFLFFIIFAVFGIGKEAEEGHTQVHEEQQRDGWNEAEEGHTEVREEQQRDGWNEEEDLE